MSEAIARGSLQWQLLSGAFVRDSCQGKLPGKVVSCQRQLSWAGSYQGQLSAAVVRGSCRGQLLGAVVRGSCQMSGIVIRGSSLILCRQPRGMGLEMLRYFNKLTDGNWF